MSAMKKKAGIEREKKEKETSGDGAQGADETERKRERERGRRRRRRRRKGWKSQRVLEEYSSRGWSRKRKIVKSRGWPGVLDEGIFTEIWILGSMDRRLSRRGGIWTHRRQGGSRRNAETEEWIEGAVESFSERIKARARSISAPRVTKE